MYTFVIKVNCKLNLEILLTFIFLFILFLKETRVMDAVEPLYFELG